MPTGPRPSTAEDELATFVQRLISASFDGGMQTVAGTALAAGMSVRSLQRRLADAGVTYSQLLEAARRDAAFRLMEDRRLSLSEIASVLGYSDPAHFTRAFIRWTGRTPRSHCARLKAEGSRQGIGDPKPCGLRQLRDGRGVDDKPGGTGRRQAKAE